MKIKKIIFVFGLLIIVFAVSLSGCKSTSSSTSAKRLPLYDDVYYYWASEYSSGDFGNIVEIISLMEEAIEASIPEVTSVLGLPPGFYAHLGLMYALNNDRAKSVSCYEMEKKLFPESAFLMDYYITGSRRAVPAAQGGEHPRSILILPVVNGTTNVDAPANRFIQNATRPLTSAGYYVLPVSMTTQVFLREGVTVADEAHNISHARLRQVFGADAVLYIEIAYCGIMIDEAIVTGACKLVDLRTGEDLWIGTGEARESIARNRRNRGFLGDLTAVVLGEAAGDIVGTIDAARNVDYGLLGIRASGIMMGSLTKNMPYGSYHPLYAE